MLFSNPKPSPSESLAAPLAQKIGPIIMGMAGVVGITGVGSGVTGVVTTGSGAVTIGSGSGVTGVVGT